MIGKINTQKWHFELNKKFSPMGAFSRPFGPCLGTVMEMDKLFLHKVVQNSPKYPLLRQFVDNLSKSKDKFLTGKSLQGENLWKLKKTCFMKKAPKYDRGPI